MQVVIVLLKTVYGGVSEMGKFSLSVFGVIYCI